MPVPSTNAPHEVLVNRSRASVHRWLVAGVTSSARAENYGVSETLLTRAHGALQIDFNQIEDAGTTLARPRRPAEKRASVPML